MKLFPFTLGRSIDLSYSSNRFVATSTLIFGVINFIYWTSANVRFSVSLYLSLMASAAVFLSWAITREIDPDHPTSANLALLLTAILLPLPHFSSPSLMLLLTFLLIARMINHSTGGNRTVLDWIIVSISIFSIRDQLFSILAKIFMSQNFSWFVLSSTAGALAGGWILTQSSINSKCDDGKTKIQTNRIKLANGMLLFLAIIVTMQGGEIGLGQIYLIWTGFLGVLIFVIYQRIRTLAKPR